MTDFIGWNIFLLLLQICGLKPGILSVNVMPRLFLDLYTKIEAPCPALAGLKRDSESSKCKEVIPFYCSSLANPVRLRWTMGNALAAAFS